VRGLRSPIRSNAEEQRVSFLRSPGSYSHRPKQVRFIQTDDSWVFIVPPFVFKVKKPVNLGFLDFSTLEKRRHFCGRELDLNRRLCPEIYLDVVPIYKLGFGFSFDPAGAGRNRRVLRKDETTFGACR
jgi:aminoglycoside phosphotransferase family enzyme